MGTALSAAQQHALLRSFRNLILMLDGDEAGRRATATIAARLRPYTSLRVIHLPDSVQPDQLSTTEIGQILHAHTGLITPDRVC